MRRRNFLITAGEAGLYLPVLGMLGCAREGENTLLRPTSDASDLSALASLDHEEPFILHAGQRGRTVLDLLQELAPSTITERTVDGLMVEEIGGVRNGHGAHFWEFWVNGEIVDDVDAAQYETREGDVVEWRYFAHPIQLPASKLAGNGHGGGSPSKASNEHWWHQRLGDAQRNYYIRLTARQHLGRWGDQCKVFVDDVVVKSASRDVVDLPLNFVQAGHADHWAKWQNHLSDPNLAIVIQNSSLPNFTMIQPGHIIQMRMRNANGLPGPHTAIVEWTMPKTMGWIDSNWDLDEMVTNEHPRTLSWFSQNVEAFTVYQIK